MSKLLSVLILLAAVFIAVPVDGGTITRGPKAAGGTDFVDATPARADEVNYDLNTIYDEFNGSVESANIAAETIVNADISLSANIAYSKMLQDASQQDMDIVDDYSDDDAEQATESDPGTSDTSTNAAHLETEIEQLRWKLHELGVGTSASAVAAAGATAALTSWIDGPHRPGNLLYNGGFDVMNTLADATNGDGWNADDVGTLAAENLVEADGQGDGQGINIISDTAAVEGVNQVLDGLKADGLYYARVSAKPDSGECRISTTGADTNELSVTSTDGGGAWEVLAGTFQVDSLPNNVTINLLAVDDTDDCIFDHAAVYEINTDPMPVTATVIEQNCSTADSAIDGAAGAYEDFDTDSVEVTVTPPGPNYILEVSGFGSAHCTAVATCGFQLGIEEDAGAPAIVRWGVETGANVDSSRMSIAIDYVKINPTAGTAYTYTLQHSNNNNPTTQFTTATEQACIMVKMYRGM